MICLRRIMPEIDFASAQIPYDTLGKLEVPMGDFQQALQEVEPSAIREVFVELPDVHWSDVGGLEHVKKQLIESVEWPLKYAKLFSKAGVTPPKGILLSGPPGCGKTLLAKAVANESQVNFISVIGPALISKFVGESEKGVREMFKKARQAAPCIIFFDEIDAMLPARGAGGTDSHVGDRVLAQFLTEMDGVEELTGVLVLGATNRPDLLDPALLRPGRFDVQVTIDPPNLAARKEILQIGLRSKKVGADVSIEELAAETEGFNGAEVEAICRRAALHTVREAIAQAGANEPVEASEISALHLKLAFEEVQANQRLE